MNLDLLNYGGYGQFVLAAFLFTFISCLILYLKTKNEFQRYEKMFLVEFKQTKVIKIETAKDKKILSSRPIF
mgnify:FL=1